MNQNTRLSVSLSLLLLLHYLYFSSVIYTSLSYSFFVFSLLPIWKQSRRVSPFLFFFVLSPLATFCFFFFLFLPALLLLFFLFSVCLFLFGAERRFLVNSFIYTQSPLQLLLSCVFSFFFFFLLSLSPIDSIFLFFLLLNSFFFLLYIYTVVFGHRTVLHRHRLILLLELRLAIVEKATFFFVHLFSQLLRFSLVVLPVHISLSNAFFLLPFYFVRSVFSFQSFSALFSPCFPLSTQICSNRPQRRSRE